MSCYVRTAAAFLLAVACQGALAQAEAVPPALSVQRIAPQLVAFAGSQGNFQSLVNGLAQGTPVQLVSVLPGGATQLVTFTPASALSPTQIAQVLETARQRLIGLGIGNPTAEQIAVTLTGGLVPTALGGAQLSGVLNPAQTVPSPAAQVQSNAAAGASATAPSPAVNVQTFPAALPRTNTSDSFAPAGATSRSPLPATSASPLPATSASPPPATSASPPPASGGLEAPPGTQPQQPAPAGAAANAARAR